MSFELFDEPPLKFLNPKPPKDFWNENRQYYPKYYSGEVFINGLLDHMLVQLPFYDTNLEVIEALNDQVITNDNLEKTSLTKEMISTFMTRNEMMASSGGIYILSDYENFIQNRIIYSIKIPKCYYYLPWCKLFNDLILLDVHVIPVGLITSRYCMGNRPEDIQKRKYFILIFCV